MENAVEALKMAASVLIFIIAIASSFSLFGTAKRTADSIIVMNDEQKYLESAELDNGILYTSSSAVEGGSVAGVTKLGDRIVETDDVISTIYRYAKEKYGVTIVEQDGTVIARYDSNTEAVMTNWYNYDNRTKEKYAEQLGENLTTEYVNCEMDVVDLERIYAVTTDGNIKIKCGAPWLGNDKEIRKRINADIAGTKAEFKSSKQTYQGTYPGEGLLEKLDKANNIIEVTNEIDQSKYLNDGSNNPTDLLQQYEMPTVEVIYII